MRIDCAARVDRQGIDDAPARIDNGGDAVVSRTQQRQPVLHRANLRLPEVLVGARRVAKPSIVRDVHDKFR